MLLPLIGSLCLKSFVLLFWTVFYGLVLYRQRLTSSELVLYLGLALFFTVVYVGLCGLEFFVLLLFLIYISAVLILFLFAFLLLPIDQPVVAYTSLAATNQRVFPDSISLTTMILIGHCAERVNTLRTYYLAIGPTDSSNLAATWEGSLNIQHFLESNWFLAANLRAHTNLSTSVLLTRKSSHLAQLMYVENYLTIGLVAVIMIMVMVGSLAWLRSATLKLA